ncbi:MAG: sigma-70 family RNA polymerase sigma factor [Acidobacteria bacterium]|nr:sigma-70 family RNA polymerase sigma factor [Acidobacteriota bacterium]
MQAAATQTARVEETASGIDAMASANGLPPAGDEAEENLTPTAAPSNWSVLVDRIRANEDAALEELYKIFSKGIRYYLCRQLGTQELDDKVHDTFLIVVQAIQRQELREPERLMGFVRTVVRRQVAAYIGSAVQSRRDYVDLDAGAAVVDGQRNPEETAMARETVDIMKTVLSSISSRDREILTRFYLLEQTQEKICEDMQLSETQFRLLKSRAKARFGELGKRRVVRGSPGSFFQRITGRARH